MLFFSGRFSAADGLPLGPVMSVAFGGNYPPQVCPQSVSEDRLPLVFSLGNANVSVCTAR